MYYFIIELKIVAPNGHSFSAHRAIKVKRYCDVVSATLAEVSHDKCQPVKGLKDVYEDSAFFYEILDVKSITQSEYNNYMRVTAPSNVVIVKVA